MKIVLAGATGFVGYRLIQRLLENNHDPIVFTRNVSKAVSDHGTSVQTVLWDSAGTDASWTEQLEDADAVINLAGESIAAKRWTATRKESIRASRISTTRSLVTGIGSVQKAPRLLINASAVGYYGHVPEGDVDENHPPANDFLGQLCSEWERQATRAADFGSRVVCLRFGIILGSEGGALEKLITPFKFFVGGPIGPGTHWFPWIHMTDAINAILHVMQNPDLRGPFNVTAPGVVRQHEFSKELGKALHRPSWLRVPESVLRIAVGEFAETLTTGQRAIPKRLLESGYRFEFPSLGPALADLLAIPTRP